MIDSNSTLQPPELSLVTVALLKGVVYQEKDSGQWHSLLKLQSAVRDFFRVLGLDLVLDETEGHAFLRSRQDGDETWQGLPRLMPRHPLSFQVSLLMALLRRKMAEFDATGGSTRLILTLEEVVELLRVFNPETSNEARLTDQVETYLKKIEELGFVKKVRAGVGTGGSDVAYEVRRLLNAFVDAQWLAEFDDRLAAYHTQLVGPGKDEEPGND